MYFITTKRMLEVCFSAHPNIQYRTKRAVFVPAGHVMTCQGWQLFFDVQMNALLCPVEMIFYGQ